MVLMIIGVHALLTAGVWRRVRWAQVGNRGRGWLIEWVAGKGGTGTEGPLVKNTLPATNHYYNCYYYYCCRGQLQGWLTAAYRIRRHTSDQPIRRLRDTLPQQYSISFSSAMQGT